MGTKVFFSSKNENHATPPALVEKMAKYLNIPFFYFDAAATDNTNKADLYATPSGLFLIGASICCLSKMDSLNLDWSDLVKKEWVWINPPYSRTANAVWPGKILSEAAKGVKICALLALRPGSIWFRSLFEAADKILFCSGRVKFEGADSGAPFDSVFLLFNSGIPGEKCEYIDLTPTERGAKKASSKIPKKNLIPGNFITNYEDNIF